MALRAGPGPNARVQRTAVEIRIAFFLADFVHAALDAHHALELHPMELQRGKRVARQLLALAAVVVGEPDQAAFIKSFDQHHAGAGAQLRGHRGQGHGVGLGHLGLQGLVEPQLELLQRLGQRLRLQQFGLLVAFAHVGQFGVAHGVRRVKGVILGRLLPIMVGAIALA